MNTMQILMEIDGKASEAHSLWLSLERFKAKVARDAGISSAQMQKNGIFVPENSDKQEPTHEQEAIA